VIVDRPGILLAVSPPGGNRHDVTRLIPLLDAIPRTRGLRGRPRRRPERLFADRGCDYGTYRRLLWKRGITPHIARRGVAHGCRTAWSLPFSHRRRGALLCGDDLVGMRDRPLGEGCQRPIGQAVAQLGQFIRNGSVGR